ncbi:unnamed protein product [Boreogadus saida]
MDQQENENTALSQVAAGVALSLLAAFVATVWWFDRQRRTSESPTRPRMEGDRSVFKVPQSPPPKTPKPSVFEVYLHKTHNWLKLKNILSERNDVNEEKQIDDDLIDLTNIELSSF